MKKNIIFMLLAFIFFIASCKKDEVTYVNVGSTFFASCDGFTSLDSRTTLNVNTVFSDIPAVAVHHLGGLEADGETAFDAPNEDLGTINLTDEGDEYTGSIDITAAQLGMTEIDMSADIKFTAEKNGKTIWRIVTVTVADPIAVEAPEVLHRSDTTYHFKFTVAPVFATVTSVTVQTKTNSGTYADVAGTWNLESEEDSIAINGSEYNVGDTLFVKVTGAVGTKTASTETEIIIGASGYKNVETFVLDTTANLAYDFILRREVDVTTAGDTSDIKFAITLFAGGYSIGFASNENAEFVEVVTDKAGVYSRGDIVQTENTDFTSSIVSDDEVAEGDVFIFRTQRGAGAWAYGIMKVVTVDMPLNDSGNSSLEIEFKY